ncbi:MAG: PHP domain-containing protein [Acidiferrobacterales bacterium]
MPHYDLHSHTYHSDGTLSPSDLVMRARSNGVDVLAVTDHDITAGIGEAQAAARTAGIVLVPGVEISVTWGAQTIHIVGLRIDPGEAGLQAGLAGQLRFRDWRAEEIGRRLERAGIHDACAGARAHTRGALIGRTHFAHFLAAQGHVRDVRDAFSKYLVRGKPGYVPGQWASLPQALGWIRASGGHAVIAHPARYKLSASRLKRLFTEFKESGGEAIEVVSGSHSRDDCLRFAALAVRYDLLASSGSDYHGPEAPWVDLGRLPPLPESCRALWASW